MAADLTIKSGFYQAIFAYDAARSINLDSSERRIHEATERLSIKHKKRAPSHIEYEPPPLRVSHDVQALNLGGVQARANVDLVVYDFGAISVIYTVPIQGPLSKLLGLSEELYDNDYLLNDSRFRIEQFIEVIGDAATNTGLASLVEDYVIFSIDSFDQPFDAEAFSREHAQEVAQILRAERRILSEQEVNDALAARISFGIDDLTIADWNATLLIDREGEDVRAVLEFANVELLEMRYLDQKLDRALDQAYETLSKPSWGLPRILGAYGADLRRVAELQVDNATLFEGVNNTLKLLGDQYLARVYRLASRRFHLDEWDASILRKLDTLESIYEKISDQANNRRMEILEWVIIILIAFSIGMDLVP